MNIFAVLPAPQLSFYVVRMYKMKKCFLSDFAKILVFLVFSADFELPGWVAGYPWSRPWVLSAANLVPSCPVLLSNVVRSWMAAHLPADTSIQLLLPDIVRSWNGDPLFLQLWILPPITEPAHQYPVC